LMWKIISFLGVELGKSSNMQSNSLIWVWNN
jgi:hypothetical protein